jgi:hypothetical protein
MGTAFLDMRQRAWSLRWELELPMSKRETELLLSQAYPAGIAFSARMEDITSARMYNLQVSILTMALYSDLRFTQRDGYTSEY